MSELVSIVVPLYNYSNYIIELVESTIKQDYQEWELIIIDDCSTDDPVKVLSPYLSEKIIYCKTDKNSGYSVAKNNGIVRSKGKYIVVIDADDILCPCSLSSRIQKMLCSDCKWVHARAYEIHGSKPYNPKFKKRKFVKLFERIVKSGNYSSVWQAIHSQTVMVKREVYEKVGLYEESMRSMSDKEMWARIYHNVGKPEYLNKFVAYYRIHNKQMHKSKEKMNKLPQLKKRLIKFVNQRKNGNFNGVRKLTEFS